ncbi:hypothetical protein CEUSTIGMA_g12129.t1 [Chlamydomonas eustigma]|uniref:tRNA ligase phosphodiesterase domain-containing protein n=1 Tax=Chlamydomonas eustigma TaxID=1157962 RepID=A0A250XNQ0_9CHLO|nr:hypothetical protein CEUSTIGMA_g12129.t1 [Chlamydomonas eustigma]|eukprot:GAX84707.1 hypothetical protein CEUSTIGMA_g12129.t1 [Chlamydomonas eustigma]
MDASTLLTQNLILLIKDLNLPVAYKAYACKNESDSIQSYLLIVHVMGDSAFKKYLGKSSRSDLMLFRGLLIKVQVENDEHTRVLAQVQQAFLPKFQNEAEDTSIATAIVTQASERYMVVTIKHSGSLITLSGDLGFAAKNSICNDYTAGAAVLLQAHFLRLENGDVAKSQDRLSKLMLSLRSRKIAVSFEMVTGCHGHHGQIPRGEYLVATSAHSLDAGTGRPIFLPWADFMHFCMQEGLPVNDTWLVAGTTAASQCCDMLDEMALTGGPTHTALTALSNLVQDHESAGCVYLPGTYPHDQWQGSRIEGFVVSQGQKISHDNSETLRALIPPLRAAVIQIDSLHEESSRCPYRELLITLKTKQQDVGTEREEDRDADTSSSLYLSVRSQCASWLPASDFKQISNEEKVSLMAALTTASPAVEKTGGELRVPLTGEVLYSRAVLEPLPYNELDQKLSQWIHEGRVDPSLSLEAQQFRQDLEHDAAVHTNETTATSQPRSRSLQARLLRIVCGPPDITLTLRYKKKMLLWTLPRLMKEPSQIVHFAECWASWIAAHGGVQSVSNVTYLLQAEQFVTDFLSSGGNIKTTQKAESLRAAGSFQGILILLVKSPELADHLQSALQIINRLDAHNLPPFRKSMVSEGSLLLIMEDQALPKSLKQFCEAAAPYLFVLVQRPAAVVPEGEWIEGPAAKKQAGHLMTKIKMFETALKGASKNLDGSTRIKQLASEQDRDDLEKLHQVSSEVVAWLGEGTPMTASDPAAVLCFVTIPGSGKTALTANLQLDLLGNLELSLGKDETAQGLGTQMQIGSSPVTVKVLNSDQMKKRGCQASRYWQDVAAAADTSVGGGARTLVIADKNLVPSPPGNLERALGQLDGGITTLGVILTCRGDTSRKVLPEIYAGLPEFPMPLELVALCMLRVLLRRNHEGKLDEACLTAMAVMSMFVNFFRNTTLNQLRTRCQSLFGAVLEVEVMMGVGDQQLVSSPGLRQALKCLSEGLSSVPVTGGDSKKPTPWEVHIRELLLEPETQRTLLSLQRPLEELQKDLVALILQQVRKAWTSEQVNAADAASLSTSRHVPSASTSAEPIRWYGIAALDVEPLLASVLSLPLPEEVSSRIRSSGKSEYHVTLWHVEDPVLGPDEELRLALAQSVGQEAVVQLISVDWNDSVVAAQVQMLSAPEPSLRKVYPHITLAVGAGAAAKDSNLLPACLDKGTAVRVHIHEPFHLTGQVLGFTTG